MLQILFHDRFVWILPSDRGGQSVLLHDSLYFLVVHGGKPHFNASPTVCTLTAIEDFLDSEVIGVILVGIINMF